MKTLLIAMTIAASSMAQASGFVCETETGFNVKVFDHTSASEGTRRASVMIISDSSVGAGNKTIAKFSDVKSTLKSNSQTYRANVDLRYSDSNRAGELILGTKLGQLDEIILSVDFSYNNTLPAGAEVDAMVTLVKRNGQRIHESAVCQRYLKGQ